MKKRFLIIMILVLVLAVSACARKVNIADQLTKEGVAPYEMTESERQLLSAYGISKGNGQIICFNAPKEAYSLEITVYQLDGDMNWQAIGGGGVSIGADRKPADRLNGLFAMKLNKERSIDINVTTVGRATFTVEAPEIKTEIVSSLSGFLTEFSEIELEKEIPAAVMVYDGGTALRSYSPQDYFEPAKFGGMDVVRVITLKFSEVF